MSEHVKVSRDGAVNVVRMHRLEKKNALTRAMYAAMAEAIRSADADDAVRVHLLLGSEGVFSAGNDLGDFMTIAMGGEHGGEVFEFMDVMIRARKPVVSGVDGIAVGIGTTIHFNCDLTIATARSSFSTPFLDLGLTPEFASSGMAPTVMGHQRAFALLALGDSLNGEEARDAGLVWKIVEPENMESEAMSTAKRLAQKPPEALAIARDLLMGDRDARLALCKKEGELFGERLKSDEARQAFQSFMSRKVSKASA
ncbi:crotonase/enoyl-CoA hydratase family protein [Notoacmeibacter sp. MSK16QG-6]|uniref:crotonase/enoyl-CoA hydratase family protein n=1 Tax=Notoacmeibacter sp. MSK16QG-6 TaxID=2957982 RepID=UPI00209D5D41|nr:crotonase/enoyl-CoA hydratase family protein [Notoacmeibacter sp. MSK16QG-6]MCP1198242.1 crotonase/enoyl-CoA hydratase family protein [Notoacmeibacter sp. MSK16QG-6]